ncbi:MAG: hypothetical protein Q8S00_05095 [Deltaproteobacteria bacterium]|nr:hypothetical protein [Deltaproteobacteria bacterium]
MKFTVPTLVIVLLSGLFSAGSDAHAQNGGGKVSSNSTSRRGLPTNAELARMRAEVIEKMKESRASMEKLLAIHQENSVKLALEYETRRRLLERELISKAELREAELALEKTVSDMKQVKRWIIEDDIAITEATMRDELLRLPALAVGGYSESGTLVRFNGGGRWSLAEAPKIEKFFAQMFGHALPITAFGQTGTHDRLRFDHRNAMDVAVHPDSSEGRSLLAYLRQTGIPFIAFRGAVAGASTGAHIHIGQPSARN